MRFNTMAFVAGISFAVPAFAQTAPATDPAAPKPVKEKKICRREAQTGSILGGASICHTKADWAKIDAANGRNADDALARSRSLQNGGINR
ncbi:MAG TPA: hypothetical protein VN137_01380 [Sphingomonas sp.]|nr:hypothetical protein [Sphingomonas sp.]